MFSIKNQLTIELQCGQQVNAFLSLSLEAPFLFVSFVYGGHKQSAFSFGLFCVSGAQPGRKQWYFADSWAPILF
jgi:hypothetical protein